MNEDENEDVASEGESRSILHDPSYYGVVPPSAIEDRSHLLAQRSDAVEEDTQMEDARLFFTSAMNSEGVQLGA